MSIFGSLTQMTFDLLTVNCYHLATAFSVGPFKPFGT